MKKYEHYIFDLYGTLVDIHTDEDAPALWTGMAAAYSRQGAVWKPDELQAAYRRLTSEAEAAMRGAPPRQDAHETHEAHPEIRLEPVFQALFQEKGVEADEKLTVRTGRLFRELSTEYIRLYGGAKELLQALREYGGKVWLLSNAQSMFTSWELERLGLTEYFDGIYLSSDYGVKKPDRRFFEFLLQERKIPAERAVMIGNDGQCDIRGGREAGLDTFYICSNLSPEEPTPEADYVLGHMDLTQVQKILTE